MKKEFEFDAEMREFARAVRQGVRIVYPATKKQLDVVKAILDKLPRSEGQKRKKWTTKSIVEEIRKLKVPEKSAQVVVVKRKEVIVGASSRIGTDEIKPPVDETRQSAVKKSNQRQTAPSSQAEKKSIKH